jgi:hypothetical protein
VAELSSLSAVNSAPILAPPFPREQLYYLSPTACKLYLALLNRPSTEFVTTYDRLAASIGTRSRTTAYKTLDELKENLLVQVAATRNDKRRVTGINVRVLRPPRFLPLGAYLAKRAALLQQRARLEQEIAQIEGDLARLERSRQQPEDSAKHPVSENTKATLAVQIAPALPKPAR